jgi:acylphosphatase
MKRLTATVVGRVQGVGFRAYTQEEAFRLHLTGWVRNEWDGSVKVVAEGPDDALNRLLAWLHRGPPSAHVNHVDFSWSDATGDMQGFQIRH